MLILSRKSGEAITIGSDITVTIVAVKGRGAKIAIQAPRDVRILRKELDTEDEVELPLAETWIDMPEEATVC